MTAGPIRDAARQLADDAGPPDPQQEATISAALSAHMQDTTAADDTAA